MNRKPAATPPGILVTVALLALYAAYDLWIAVVERSWLSGLAALVAVVACVGAALLRPWSRYLVYVLTAAFIGTWGYSLYTASVAGYFNLYTTQQLVVSLAPGALLVVLSAACTYFVTRQFRA
jgi:hypothetical protein